MKRLSLIGLVALLPFAGLQSAVAQEVWLGVKGGVNSATVAFSDPGGLDINRLTSFHAGPLLAVDLHEAFWVHLAVLYSGKGYKALGLGTDGKAAGGYLEIPLLANIRIPARGVRIVSPHVFVGPGVSFELRCQVTGVVSGAAVDQPCDDFGMQRKKFDIGLMFGGGLEIGTGPTKLLLDAAYDLGLRNLDDDPLSTETVRSRTWCFSAGLLYRLGRER